MNRFLVPMLVLLYMGCTTPKSKDPMEQAEINRTSSQHVLQTYELKNSHGLRMEVTNYGGKVMSLWVPDKSGKLGDVMLGYDSASQYTSGNLYFGALIGRYGNRIAKGTFSLENKNYQLATNNGENALHGGPGGFHVAYWEATKVTGNSLELRYVSRDGEEGYPGNLEVKVIYTLTESDEWTIDYFATTDKTTIVNLSQHAYFNLAGESSGDVLKQQIQINADHFVPVDKALIPLGELRDVKGTPFDFRTPRVIGERIDEHDEQLMAGIGYDHNWVLNKKGKELSLAAKLSDPSSGRTMEVWTTEPGMQFYTGNFLTGKDIGKGGKPYGRRSGLCLETQHFPDSPNHPAFPSTVLKPGEVYRQTTKYKFLVSGF